jgi:hypothetical protein
MRVLYLASNPKDEETLRLEQEITEIQRTIDSSNAGRADFVFLPALPYEDIEQQIAIHQPDILHISAHGTKKNVRLADSTEGEVELTAEALRTLVSSHPPKLMVLNACTSVDIAKEMIDTVPFALGMTEPITNLAARKSAVNLYRKLLRGESLQSAFQSAQATVKTLSRGKVSAELSTQPGVTAHHTFFSRVPRIVAHFHDHTFSAKKSEFAVYLGLHGASEDTVQVCFVTDDETFLTGKPENLENELSSIVRTTSIESEIWLDYTWHGLYGDCRLYALAITTSGRCYSVASTLCNALNEFYATYFDGIENAPPDFRLIVGKLRENDGALVRSSKLSFTKRKQRLASSSKNQKKKRRDKT